MDDQLINMRFVALEARVAYLEQLLTSKEQGTTTITMSAKQKKHKDLSPEQRAAIRARLVAGKEAKKQKEIAEAVAVAKTEKPAKKKETKNGTSEAAN